MVLESADLRVQALQAPTACGANSPAPPQQPGDGTVQAESGDTLQLGIRWGAKRPPSANYTVFVQLLDGEGRVQLQTDRWPADGLSPTAAMGAGEVITDNLAFRLDVPPGSYRLIAGMYLNDGATMPRLAGPGGDTVFLAGIDVR